MNCFFVAGFCLLVGLIIFGVKVADEVKDMGVTDWFLNWSFSLACTAFVLNQIAASLLITENKRLIRIERETDTRGSTVAEEKRKTRQRIQDGDSCYG